VHSGKVYVFGGGHVARELVPLLSHLEFRCIVLDDRPRFACKTRFPDAEEVLPVDFFDIGKSISVTSEDYLVIMTRGHQYDTVLQAQALRTNAFYIGVMGSRRKIRSVQETLRAEGFTREDFRRVHTPIGLPINGETPAELAVSIAGELIRERADRLSDRGDRTHAASG